MKFGIEKYSADLCAAIAADNAAQLAGANRLFDSPIEALFYTALRQSLLLHPRYRGMELMPLAALEAGDLTGDVYVGWQEWVLDWPVDFAIAARSRGLSGSRISRLVVECDGHEFHERTKDQAKRDRSRDRALQLADHTIMRFTGSEIYRDPLKCACEALDWCLNHVEEALS